MPQCCVAECGHCWLCIVAQAWECANKLGLIGPAMEQPQYNMFEREKVIPFAAYITHVEAVLTYTLTKCRKPSNSSNLTDH